MKAHVRYFWLLVIILISCSGCADKIEIEEEGFVLTLGIDLAEDGEGLAITYEIADPMAGNPGSDPSREEVQAITLNAPDILSARDLTNASETRNVNFYHTKAIVFSEELARSERFLEVIEMLTRDRQIRRTMYFIISKERAEEFIRNNKPALEASPHKYFDFMSRRWKRNALVPDTTLHNFLHETYTEAGLALGIYTTTNVNEGTDESENSENEDNFLPGEIEKKGGTTIQTIGAAVFKNGKMIGTMTGEEQRITAILKEDVKPSEILFTFPDPLKENTRITGKATNIRTKVNINVDESTPKVYVQEWMEIKILSLPSMIDYVEDMNKQKILIRSLEERFTSKALRFINRTQTEFEAEPFNWASTVRSKFFTYQEYVTYDWMQKYKDADVQVEFIVTIDDMGKMLKPHKISKENEGE
ncbi:Ger(x)C family spore germination protein [Bacillus weihaiensis]|uniref:Ger(x)C family spore germination protein n=1 Tax=Bacillus weihaiensis TaxID=1547283 RepID=UPI0023536127|nr:Ger(x)C family spore germination protein [Bacillus weihaiensis]